jgi:hypothetical protein
MDRVGKSRTGALHQTEQGEGRESQSFSVKLLDGQLQTLTLLQRAAGSIAPGLVLEGRPQGAKCRQDSGFVGVVFVRDCHGSREKAAAS